MSLKLPNILRTKNVLITEFEKKNFKSERYYINNGECHVAFEHKLDSYE